MKVPERVFEDFAAEISEWRDRLAVEWETLPLEEREFEYQEAELAAIAESQAVVVGPRK